ncbi:TPA: hypothetical protein ACH2I9_004183 [Enterobacter asburiae]
MLKSKINLVVGSLFLAGCSSATYNEANNINNKNKIEAETLLDSAKNPGNTADMKRVPVRRGVYLGATATKLQSGQMLPNVAERGGIRLLAPDPKNLLEIGDLISEASGIPVSFADDIFSKKETKEDKSTVKTNAFMSGESKADELAAALETVLPKASVVNGSGRSPTVFSGMLKDITRDQMRVNYTGTLSGFLNLTAAYFDIGWTYHDGRIQFSRQITRTFQLASLPTQLSSSASMTGGVSASGGEGADVTTGSTQTSQINMSLDFWKEINETLKNIVGDQGTFTASPTSNSITVNGPASMVEKVGREVQEINRKLLRQVSLKVEVYRVTLSRKSDWNFDFNAAFASGVGKYGFGTANPVGTANAGFANIAITDGKFSGSKAALSLLEENGDVSVLTTSNVTTMSGQPVPVQVSNTRGYIEKISSIINENTVTKTAETKTATAGFSMSLMPTVMDNGNILLQYNMNISSFAGKDNGFNNVKVGDDEIQLLNVDQRSFIQSGMIRNGSTLIVAGFEQTSNNTSDIGQGTSSFKLVGGSRGGEKNREMLIVMITPNVLDHTLESGQLN